MTPAERNARAAAELAVGSCRAMVTHCPVCLKEHHEDVRGAGMWIDETLTRKIIYFFCRPCGRRYEKAGKKNRQRTLDRIERNLEDLGVLAGLKKEGLKA